MGGVGTTGTLFRSPASVLSPSSVAVVGASQREVPEPVEHAMVIVPAAAVADVLLDADAAGVKSATVYAAAMGDGTDPESKKRGAWLKDFLQRSALRLAGPNCMGAHSYHERLFAYPNTELGRFPA